MIDIPLLYDWARFIRLPKDTLHLLTARDDCSRRELYVYCTKEDWERYQRLKKEIGLDRFDFEKRLVSSDLSVTDLLALIELEHAEQQAKMEKNPNER